MPEIKLYFHILSYHILSYLIVSYLILSYLILSYLILSYLILNLNVYQLCVTLYLGKHRTELCIDDFQCIIQERERGGKGGHNDIA